MAVACGNTAVKDSFPLNVGCALLAIWYCINLIRACDAALNTIRELAELLKAFWVDSHARG